MLSYRHAFHAGNYADVLKHFVLIEILDYLTKKNKPFEYIDTHAGAGLYLLGSKLAQQNKEYENGIGRLNQVDWPELKTYLDIIDSFNPDKTLQIYPGSPKIAQHFLREQDRAWLYELHKTDFESLQKVFEQQPNIRISQDDGFEEMLRLLPPKSKRALVLIDPSYEVKSNYAQVADILIKAHRRFATGTYALWYPVVERRRIVELEKTLINSGIRRIQLFELGQQALSQTSRMHANGMIVVNPPWPLFEKMQTLLPKLARAMTIVGKPYFRCEEIVGE